MNSISLGDADVWDDSALIRSWDQALDEYKKYHSIQARGEMVDIVLQEHLNGEDQTSELKPQHDDEDDNQSAAMSEEPTSEIGAAGDNPASPERPAQSHRTTGVEGAAVVPSALLASQDPLLQNLMMSWYWTGYYSGLQAAQTAGDQHTATNTADKKK